MSANNIDFNGLMYCPEPGCGAKHEDGFNYLIGETCPNGHIINPSMVAPIVIATMRTIKERKVVPVRQVTVINNNAHRNICSNCGHRNDEIFMLGEPCPNCKVAAA